MPVETTITVASVTTEDTTPKLIQLLYARRKKQKWTALRTAQAFEMEGLTLPETLRLEVLAELKLPPDPGPCTVTLKTGVITLPSLPEPERA